MTIGDPLTARLAAERALRLNPRLTVAARTRGLREIDTLRRLGVGRLADPEAEVAFELARHALQRMGVSGAGGDGIVSGLRRDVYGRLTAARRAGRIIEPSPATVDRSSARHPP